MEVQHNLGFSEFAKDMANTFGMPKTKVKPHAHSGAEAALAEIKKGPVVNQQPIFEGSVGTMKVDADIVASTHVAVSTMVVEAVLEEIATSAAEFAPMVSAAELEAVAEQVVQEIAVEEETLHAAATPIPATEATNNLNPLTPQNIYPTWNPNTIKILDADVRNPVKNQYLHIILPTKHDLYKIGVTTTEIVDKVVVLTRNAALNGKIPQSGKFTIREMQNNHVVEIRGFVTSSGEIKFSTFFVDENCC